MDAYQQEMDRIKSLVREARAQKEVHTRLRRTYAATSAEYDAKAREAARAQESWTQTEADFAQELLDFVAKNHPRVSDGGVTEREKFLVRLLVEIEEGIGDPVHPKHRNETYHDLNDRIESPVSRFINAAAEDGPLGLADIVDEIEKEDRDA